MPLDSALQLIESAAKKRVLFAGEVIRDVYRYCSPLGRPTKDLIISVQQHKSKEWSGGIIAAANHAIEFCETVNVWSDMEITKIRYVEEAHFRKLFEVYDGIATCNFENPNIPDFDAVCVVDYGHGMLTETRRLRFEQTSRFLAANVQTNSGNYGFNLATKYGRCDYLVVDETEARLATSNQNDEIEESLMKLGQRCEKVIITLGVKGAIGMQNNQIYWHDAMTTSVVDTMGAGDAFFAVTAPMAEEGSIEDLLLIGNAAGALKAQHVGQRPIKKNELIAYLKEHANAV